jgi:hypothetical protein
MTPLFDLVGSTEFAIGLLVGTIALLITLPAALGLRALRPKRGRRPGLFGLAFAAGGVLALDGRLGTDELLPVPGELGWGLLLLWIAGTVAARTPSPLVVGPLAALPGALLVAGANEGLDAGWVPVVIVLGTAVLGATAADLDHRLARFGLGPLLFAVAVLGIYFTVPDTEIMRAIVGVTVPLVLLAWPYAAAALGPGGGYAGIALLLWIVPIEGIGRPGAVVGAVGAFGLLLAEPLGRALVPYVERRLPVARRTIKQPRAIYFGAQVALTLYASRVAGMAQEALLAALLLIPALAAGLAFGVLLVMPERRRRRKRRNGSSGPSTSSAPTATRPSSNGGPSGRSNGHGGGDR